MKTLMPKITVEDTYTCDWCGKDCGHWPTATCFECGKHSCNNSCWYTHLREYKGGWPAKLEVNCSYLQHGTGYEVPHLFFCHDCDKTSKVAALLRELEAEWVTLKCAFDTYRNNHYQMASKVNRMIERKENQS